MFRLILLVSLAGLMTCRPTFTPSPREDRSFGPFETLFTDPDVTYVKAPAHYPIRLNLINDAPVVHRFLRPCSHRTVRLGLKCIDGFERSVQGEIYVLRNTS